LRSCCDSQSRAPFHDPATSEFASDSKLGIDARIPQVLDTDVSFKRRWPPLMDAAVKAKVQELLARSSRREEAQIQLAENRTEFR